MRSRTIACLAACLSTLLFAACGGGGGGGDDDNQAQQVSITSTGNLDGVLQFNNNGSVNEGQSGGIPLTGDQVFQPSGATIMYQSLWSFDLSSLPAGATITNVTLRLFQTGAAGSPDAAFVLARLDHVNFGATFPATVGAVVNISTDIAQVNDLTTAGARTLDVTAAVQADIAANRTRSQFRLRTAIGTNNDAQADFSVWTDADNTANAANRPMLIVSFTPAAP